MKHIFYISFILSLLFLIFLTSCNPNSGRTTNSGNSGETTKEEMYEAKLAELRDQIINNAIDELNTRVSNAQITLSIHANQNWNAEGYEQFNMHYDSKNKKVFDILKKDNKLYYHDDNKNARRKFYLALEYHEASIVSFGSILNMLSKGAVDSPQNKQYSLLKDIVEATSKFATNYFEVALTTLTNKKDKLTSLSLEELKELQNKFRRLEEQRQLIRKRADEIQNKFKDANTTIGTQNNLIKYIEDEHQAAFVQAFAKIETLANEIKEILDKLDKI
ncbi:virulence associated lipoprotein [Borrelia turicatae]|uniref:virulence associated lipoprotein n=1 Tax=Borrelia turicatae TaxID=142 RepID=UPI002ED0A83D